MMTSYKSTFLLTLGDDITLEVDIMFGECDATFGDDITLGDDIIFGERDVMFRERDVMFRECDVMFGDDTCFRLEKK